MVTQRTARRGPANGEANKLLPRDRAVHDWYRFVLSFPPHLVRKYLQRFGADAGQTVLDPFCGTGTTLVECKKLGTPSMGVEANPVAYFASKVKVDWSPDPDGLAQHAREVAARALEQLSRDGIEDTPVFFDGQQIIQERLRTLPEECWDLLLADSISPLPLHKTLVLLDAITQHRDERYYAHELLALAKIVVYSASNLQFGPEVGVGPCKPDAPVVGPWLSAVHAMAEDLRSLRTLPGATATVYYADARRIHEILPPNSVDAVITSPPYPNEKDYTYDPP